MNHKHTGKPHLRPASRLLSLLTLLSLMVALVPLAQAARVPEVQGSELSTSATGSSSRSAERITGTNSPLQVSCLPGAMLEGEPPLVDEYVDNHNGGCNTVPPPFQQVNNTDFCGVSGWYDFQGSDYRDTDWLWVTASGTQIVWTVDADQETYMFLLGGTTFDCSGTITVDDLATASPGIPGQLIIPTTPGETVFLWVGPTEFNDPSGGNGEYSYTFNITGIETPAAVELASFTAASQGSAIVLEWETATELDNLGFNVYRSGAAEGERIQLNAALIPAQNPGSVLGATYRFLDETATPGVIYYYWLEDVDAYGAATLHGPVSGQLQSLWRLLPARPRIAPAAAGLQSQ